MQPLKILVVGGGGFLGNQIIKALRVGRREVISAGRSNRDYTPGLSVTLDIAIPGTYLGVLNEWKPDVVIQCAWPTEQSSYRETNDNIRYLNYTTTFADACFSFGVKKFIGLGSCAEYGNVSNACDADSTPAEPIDLYGKSKLETLQRLQEIAIKKERSLTWARIFQPYGLGQDDSRLIPGSVRKLLLGSPITLQNPDLKLDWISSRDVGDAINFILTNHISGVVDVGTGIGTSVEELLLNVTEILGQGKDLILRAHESDILRTPNHLIVSKNTKLFSEGWIPKDSLQNGLRWAINL